MKYKYHCSCTDQAVQGKVVNIQTRSHCDNMEEYLGPMAASGPMLRLRLRHLSTRLHISDSDGLRHGHHAWPSNQSTEVSNYYRRLVVSCHSTKQEVEFLRIEIVILNVENEKTNELSQLSNENKLKSCKIKKEKMKSFIVL